MARLKRSGCIGLLALGLIALSTKDALGQSEICAAGPQTITGVVIVTEPCTVTGDLVIEGNGILFVNYRGAPEQRFTIEGNLIARGSSAFYFAGGVLEFQQDFREQRVIRSFDQARLVVVEAEVATSQNEDNKFMYYFARDESQAIFMNSRLNFARSWLIAQLFDASTAGRGRRSRSVRDLPARTVDGVRPEQHGAGRMDGAQ